MFFLVVTGYVFPSLGRKNGIYFFFMPTITFCAVLLDMAIGLLIFLRTMYTVILFYICDN